MNSKLTNAWEPDFIARHLEDDLDGRAEALEKARVMPEFLQRLLNEQFMREKAASYLYLSLVNYFEGMGLCGFSHWMRSQVQEETDHAMKIFQFMHDRGVKVELGMLAAPKADFDSPVVAVKKALEHERLNTIAIKELYAAANQAQEYDLTAFLQWFLSEQVEEENSILKIIQDLQRAGDSDTATLLLLDRELGKR